MLYAARAPVARLLLIAVAGLVAGGLALAAALHTPWIGLGLQLSNGDILAHGLAAAGQPPPRLLAIGAGPDRVVLEPADLIEEPDTLPSYAAFERVFERQSRIAALLQAGSVPLDIARPDGARDVVSTRPGPRPLSALPPAFWVQLVTGIGGLLIGGWVWSIRPKEAGTRLFAVSGVGLMASALAAAVYSSRELALDGALFEALSRLNHLGADIFAAAMIGLFLRYPKPLGRPAWLLAAPAAIGALMIAEALRLGPDPGALLYGRIMVATLVILTLIIVQWTRTGRDPQGRAALTWLALSVMAGCGAYAILAAAPVLFGLAAWVPQGYAFGFFLVIYVGLALGLGRHRLFEASAWAYRVLFFTLGAVLLLLVDAALVMTVHLHEASALGLSLVLVGFLYLPLRDIVWRRIGARRRFQEHELFAAALEVAFADGQELRAARWRDLLQRLFDPLDISDGAGGDRPQIEQDGLVMALPSVADTPPLRLAYPNGGRGLFTPDQLKLAQELVALTSQAQASRDAHERGAAEERSRMARDLHDDVGARLLSGLHMADPKTRPVLHAALSDIRSIVSGLTGEQAALSRVVADMRHEASRRLEAAGVALSWRAEGVEDSATPLDYRRHKALTSALREAISNVLRHAEAHTVDVELSLRHDRLRVLVRDDGHGFSPAALTGDAIGLGMRGMRQRMAELGGAVQAVNGPEGADLVLELPLDSPAVTVGLAAPMFRAGSKPA